MHKICTIVFYFSSETSESISKRCCFIWLLSSKADILIFISSLNKNHSANKIYISCTNFFFFGQKLPQTSIIMFASVLRGEAQGEAAINEKHSLKKSCKAVPQCKIITVQQTF